MFFLPISCFLAGSLYCVGLTYGSFIWHNIFTVFFNCFLFLLILLNCRRTCGDRISLITQEALALNLGMALTALVLGSPETFFWVPDSLSTHLPESLKVADQILLRSEGGIGKHYGITTHVITGLFLSIFGKNTFATIFAQSILKVVTLISVFKIAELLWDKRSGFIASQLYAFCPTVFFYNVVLYKEATVQSLFSIIVLSTLQVALRKKAFWLLPLILANLLMTKERFYIGYLFLPVTLLSFIDLLPRKVLVRVAALLLLTSVGSVVAFVFREKVFDIINSLSVHRNHYASYSDALSKYNYEIPYPVAFLKILFSPYFSFNKFSLFSDFSLLLIWGSFLNQVIILSSLLGFFEAVKYSWKHLLLWLPFIVFLIFAAYISPWSGRLRDSFYPLLACYGGYFLAHNRYFNAFLFPRKVSDP